MLLFPSPLRFSATCRQALTLTLLLLAILLPSGLPASGQESAPLKDLHGDPLPAGAIARLGSSRLRHVGLSDLVFTPDGRHIVSVGADRNVNFWDLKTGLPAKSVALQGTGGMGRGVALSPDGSLLATADARAIVLWDVATGKERQRRPFARENPSLSYLYISPDNRWLVVGYDRAAVCLHDLKEGTQRDLPLPLPRNFQGGSDSTCHASFSPDSKFLATGPWATWDLCLWELSTGKLLHRFQAGATVSAFTPDSKTLAVASQSAGGAAKTLRFYDVATGKETSQIPLPGEGFHWWITFSPDGKTIVPVDTEGVYFLNAATGKEERRLSARELGRQRMVFYSPNGKTLVGGGSNRIRLWDVATWRELQDRPGDGESPYSLAYNADGRTLAAGYWIGPSITLWDANTGRRMRQLDAGHSHGYAVSLAFRDNGRTLFVGNYDNGLTFFDLGTGRAQKILKVSRPDDESIAINYRAAHLSPDGRRVALLEPLSWQRNTAHVSLWDTHLPKRVAGQSFALASVRGWAPLGDRVALGTSEGITAIGLSTGRFETLIPGVQARLLAASADQRMIASTDEKFSRVQVWEAATRKKVAELSTSPIQALAFAGDGLTLLTLDTKTLRLWDLLTEKERYRVALPEPGLEVERRETWAVAPDGRRVTTTCRDGTLLVWDLPPRNSPPEGTVDIGSLWKDLGSDDARLAFLTLRRMRDAPNATMKFLRAHLKPVVLDRTKVLHFVRDLDSEDFATREDAMKELERLGGSVSPLLREVLRGDPSAEVRRRVGNILDKIADQTVPPDSQRILRALNILEWLGTPEALAILDQLAKGEEEAVETREARAASARLRDRVPTLRP